MTQPSILINNFSMVFRISKGWILGGCLLLLCCRVAAQGEDTNIVAAAQTDEDASWESVFTEENQIPFHINLYIKRGLFYELMETSEYQAAFFTSVFSEKRRITGKLGMKIHADMAGYHAEGNLQDINSFDTTMRRFRLNTFGRAYLFSPLTYGLEFGMAGGKFIFNNGYIWFHEVPYISSVRFGIFTPPMSLEALQSSSSIPLMENAAPISAFTPGDLLGLQLGGGTLKERATLHAGWFADVGSSENRDESQSYSRFMTRLTFLPRDQLKQGGDGALLHTGVGASYMFVSGDGVRFRSRPESFMAPFLIDTGSLEGDRALMYNAELAWQRGPLLLQGEFYQTFTDDEFDILHQFYGAYFMVNMVFTGEQRNYNRQSGIFSKLIPKQHFSFREKAWGALEWSTRVSYTDLSDDTVKGGTMFVASTGLNIYLSDRTRIMTMGGVADVTEKLNEALVSENGQLYFIQTRFQIDL